MSGIRNTRSEVAMAIGILPVTITSDTTSDADPQYGGSIDRLALGRRYLGAKFGVEYQGAAVNGKTGSVTLGIQDSADNVTFAAYATDETPAASVFGSSATSASSTGGNSSAAHPVDLSRARRYIRGSVTCDFGATSSNMSLTAAGMWAFVDAEVQPAT